MNILLIIFVIVLVWRIGAGVKRGVVRETIGFINLLFASIVLGLVSMIFQDYHAGNYLRIVVMVIAIAALSIIYSLLKMVFFPAKVITKLPVLSSVDKLLGVIIGVAETLIAFWALCCVLMYMDIGVLKEQVMPMISESRLLTFLYQYNLVGLLLEAVRNKIA